MKQKYTIIRDDDQKTLVVREYAELDKEMMSLLCEETYTQQAIAKAVKLGKQAVIDAVRTNNMYPPTAYAEPIAEAIKGLFVEGGNFSAELFFDDKEMFSADAGKFTNEPEEESDEDVDVEELLDEEVAEDNFENDKVLKDLKSSLQVAEEDNNDLDEAS